MTPQEKLAEWIYDVARKEDATQWQKSSSFFLKHKETGIEVSWSGKEGPHLIYLNYNFPLGALRLQVLDNKGIVIRLRKIMDAVDKIEEERIATEILKAAKIEL